MANLPANLPLCSHRYLLMVSYIGTKYFGSQRLANRNLTDQETIQGALETALEVAIPRTRCRLTAASRTDKGVHAISNCYTLPLMDFSMPTSKLKRLTNEFLFKRQHDIVVNEVLLVPADFHPRKLAVSREYIYRIGVPRWLGNRFNGLLNRTKTAELFQAFPATELYRILPVPYINLDKFEEAANLLRGEHDFASFSFQSTDRGDTIRTLEISLLPVNERSFEQDKSKQVDIYNIHFKSRAFLHNQIRRTLGAILSYASYDTIKLDDIARLLANPVSACWDPNMVIVEPWGLYLYRLNYEQDCTKRTYEEDLDEETVDVNTITHSIINKSGVDNVPC